MTDKTVLPPLPDPFTTTYDEIDCEEVPCFSDTQMRLYAERAVLASAGEQAKDAERGRWIIDNSSVGGGIANMQATPRPAKFIRFPAIEGDTVESAIDAAIAGKSEVQG